MDQDIFGQKPKTPIEEAWHKEQERKKYDIIRVKNPTNDDFYVMYDVNQHQKVPANSVIDVPRYIATRYVQHMKDKIVHERAQKMHDAFIAERTKKGLPAYTDKAVENNETYLRQDFPKTNDPKIIEELANELWVGIVHEFGRDVPPPMANESSGQINLTAPEMQALEKLEHKRVTDTPMEVRSQAYVPEPSTASIPTPPSGFATMSQKLSASEVTQE